MKIIYKLYGEKQMKKIIIIFLILLLLPDISFASEQINIKEFVSEIKNYNDETFPEFSDEEWITNVINRRIGFSWTRCYKKNYKRFFK